MNHAPLAPECGCGGMNVRRKDFMTIAVSVLFGLSGLQSQRTEHLYEVWVPWYEIPAATPSKCRVIRHVKVSMPRGQQMISACMKRKHFSYGKGFKRVRFIY